LVCVLVTPRLDAHAAISRRLRALFEWHEPGTTNGHTQITKMDCEIGGHPVCCGLESITDTEGTKGTQGTQGTQGAQGTQGTQGTTAPLVTLPPCSTVRKYISSPYELMHIKKAEELQGMQEGNPRIDALVDFMIVDIPRANVWLARVQARMGGGEVEETEDDLQYLSRFEVTRSCTGAATESWLEWIEPLTVHARHPFAFANCHVGVHNHLFYFKKHFKSYVPQMHFPHGFTQVDYILIKNAASIARDLGAPVSTSTYQDPLWLRNQQPTKLFFLDAGTSIFPSSLSWFVCAYLQGGVVFSQIYGWEYSLLDPVAFWKLVPQPLISLYHFFNSPVTAGRTDDEAPLRIVKEVARAMDFVSFKLDIDRPEVEIPIALELLRDPELALLVDEFFFELHFRCELMLECGWGHDIPHAFDGLKLDRESALHLFREMRERGIRAHIWV